MPFVEGNVLNLWVVKCLCSGEYSECVWHVFYFIGIEFDGFVMGWKGVCKRVCYGLKKRFEKRLELRGFNYKLAEKNSNKNSHGSPVIRIFTLGDQANSLLEAC
jgi:hypothetical protein